MHKLPDQPAWRSGWTFCFVVAGLMVGLQLVWTLPALLVRFGGLAFLSLYFAALLFFAMPLLAIEIWLGRKGESNPVSAVKLLQIRSGVSNAWRALGPMHIVVSVLLLSYLCVVGGWTLSYALDSYQGEFLRQPADHLVSSLGAFLQESNRMIGLLSVFLLAVTLVSSAGVRRGLGFAPRVLLPMLMVLLLLIVAENVSVGSIDLLVPNASLHRQIAFSSDAIWSAVALAFFTSSIGVGGIMACAAYMPEHQSLGSAIAGALGITVVTAVLITVALLPVLLHANVEVAEGAPAVFLNLPLAFGASVNGDYFGTLFFLAVAAIIFCSALVLLEPLVSWLKHVLSVPRYVAAFAGGGLVWLLTVIVSLSFNDWSEFYIVAGLTPFGFVELLTAYVLIPAIAIANGWFFVALLRSPSFSNHFPVAFTLAARLHIGYVVPVVVAGTVWYALQNRVFF